MNNSSCSLETHVYSYSAGALASSLLVKKSWRTGHSDVLLSANNINVKSFPGAQPGGKRRGRTTETQKTVAWPAIRCPVPDDNSSHHCEEF